MAIAAPVYRLVGLNWFDTVSHAPPALSTGGFSARADSIGAYNSVTVEAVRVVPMLLGTTSFSIHLLLVRVRACQAGRQGELRFLGFVMLILIPLILVFVTNSLYAPFRRAIRVAVLFDNGSTLPAMITARLSMT